MPINIGSVEHITTNTYEALPVLRMCRYINLCSNSETGVVADGLDIFVRIASGKRHALIYLNPSKK